ncbi:MAG: WD40/YVTN/BNR-like repeat-containing protein [Bryobacteraceae bacterium]
MRTLLALAGLLAAGAGTAFLQTTSEPSSSAPVLQNTGKPMVLPFSCTDDDITAAGMTCTEQEPCPVYIEFTSVEALGNQLLVAGNLHSSSATLYTVLLSSPDGGKTWSEAFERVRHAALDQIRFYGFQNGWISGQTLVPIPSDPFFLVTRDGGKTWRRKPLHDDGRPGTILQFWFDSAKDGAVLLDRGQSSDGNRYEYHESPNGGESWMVRETSDKPIRPKRLPPPPESSVVRVRADERSKSYNVEKQEGGKWKPLASFALEAGLCKPPTVELKEPEPPAEPTSAAPAASGVLVVPSDPEKRRKPPSLKRAPK